MTRGFPRLLGDIGGTNARWAWQAAPGAALQHHASYRCAEFASPQADHSWSFSIAALQAALGAASC